MKVLEFPTDEELIRWYRCERKREFGTLEDAKADAIRVSAEERAELHPYECEFGEHFHIGRHSESLWSAQRQLYHARRKWAFEFVRNNFPKQR